MRVTVALLLAVLVLVSLAGCRPATRQLPPPAAPPAAPPARAGLTPPPQTPPPGAPAQILHYTINAKIEPTERHWLQATAKLDWEVYQPVERLGMALRPSLKVTRALVGETPVEVSRGQEGALRLTLPKPVPAGAKFTTTFDYEGEVYGPKGGSSGRRLWDSIGPEGTYVRFEAGWYPRIEGDAATADLTLSAPEGWRVVTSGARGSEQKGTFQYRVGWPTANLSFTAAPYAVMGDNTGPVPVECNAFLKHEAGGRKLMEECKRILGVYGEIYGDYPFGQFSIAEIPNSYGGGHGDQGFIMLYEDAFTKPLDREFVAHEIAHNWWGSLVSCADTEFPTEGSANYAQALYLEQTDGAAAFREAMKKQAEAVLIASLDEKPKSCYEADSGPLLYDKGAWILHMLRRLVGDEAWFATVKRFVRDHAGKVYTCAQFQEAFEQGSGQKLGWFFDQWLRGTDIPWVRGKLTNLGGGKVKLTLTQDKVKGGRDAEEAQSAWETTPCRMRLAVEVELRGDGEPVRKSVWLTEPKQDFELTVPGTPTEVAIDPDGWLLSHHRGLVSELDQEMQKLDEELKRELGDLDKDTE